MRRTTLRGLGLLVAATACGDTNPVEPAGTFYLSGTVTYATTGVPFEAEIEVQQPLGETVATTRTNAAGRYELTFSDSQCRESGGFTVSAYASGGGYYPASGVLPCKAKGSPYVVNLTMVARQ
jgi:hypothetical protein